MFASTPDAANLEELARFADKIMQVVTPAVSSINAVTEVEHIREEVDELKCCQTTQMKFSQTYTQSSSTLIPWPETVTRSGLLVSHQVC